MVGLHSLLLLTASFGPIGNKMMLTRMMMACKRQEVRRILGKHLRGNQQSFDVGFRLRRKHGEPTKLPNDPNAWYLS